MDLCEGLVVVWWFGIAIWLVTGGATPQERVATFVLVARSAFQDVIEHPCR